MPERVVINNNATLSVVLSGPNGPAGPNNLTTSTTTNITGVLKGDGANVAAAVANTDFQGVPEVKSTSFTAAVNGRYVVDATATVTDPATPVQGKGFEVLVRNGTATVGGTAYSDVGTLIKRIYHSGSYTNIVFKDAGDIDLVDLDITGGTDIGEALADGDQLPVYNASAAANRKAAMTRVITYVESKAVDDGTGTVGKLLKTDALGGVSANQFNASNTVVVGAGSLHSGAINPPAAGGASEVGFPEGASTGDYLAVTGQVDGSIRGTDLDYTNTTEIGAALADADEFFVSDGGGNTTRRKSLISRLWTYIQNKLSSTATQISSIELGDASDTTLSRASAGRLAVEGVNVPTISSTDTFSNKSFSTGVSISGNISGGNILSLVDTSIADQNGLKIYSKVDPINGSYAATFLAPTIDNHQINFGDTSFIPYSYTFRSTDGLVLNFSNGAVWNIKAPTSTTLTIGDFWTGTYAASGSTATNTFVNRDTTTGITLAAKGVASQTGDLIQAQTSAGTAVFKVGIDGTITTNSATWNGSTITGAQTMSGQLTLTGQSASADNSAMTRSLSDTRYLQRVAAYSTSNQDSTTTTFADTALAASLSTGYWKISVVSAFRNPSGTDQGGVLRVNVSSGSVTCKTFSVTRGEGGSWLSYTYDSLSGFPASLGLNSSSDIFGVQAVGVIEVTSAAVINIQMAQGTASANTTRLLAGASLICEKLP